MTGPRAAIAGVVRDRHVVAWALAVLAVAPALAAEPAATLIDQARDWSNQLQTQIRSDVVKELQTGGPLRSLVVCKYSAPEVTSVLSRRHGARITRVSLRPRNPATGMADAWEQKTLQEFESRVARGDPGDRLEYGELVSEPAGRFYRYARAITVLSPCLVCHGVACRARDALRAIPERRSPGLYRRAGDRCGVGEGAAIAGVVFRA